MYDGFYLTKNLIQALSLLVINIWCFGGFGLDKTFVFIFFEGLCQFLIQFVSHIIFYLTLQIKIAIFGYFMSSGGRVLFNLSFIRQENQEKKKPNLYLGTQILKQKYFTQLEYRQVAQMFIEPFFVMILTDFTVRLCNLRNERQISQKLKPFSLFIGLLSLLRFFSTFPDLFVNVENVIFVNYEGSTHYKLTFEDSIPYQALDLLMITYSLFLLIMLYIWLRKHVLLVFWIIKVSIVLAITVFKVKSFILNDTLELINFMILYQYLTMQTLLCDVEDSREKLDRFFSYNFLFFDDD